MKHILLFLTIFCSCTAAQLTSARLGSDNAAEILLSYPANFTVTELPCALAQSAAQRGLQSLLYVSANFSGNPASIHVTFDRRKFSLKNLQETYAHTGWVRPDVVRFGKYTFFYYGPGGGGVTYPDDYFFNLNGHILKISFDGPYGAYERTPSPETKQLEKKLLRSIRIATFPAQK